MALVVLSQSKVVPEMAEQEVASAS